MTAGFQRWDSGMRWFVFAYRLFCAGILGVFAFVPVYVCFHTLRTVIEEPAKFHLFFILVFSCSAALGYFLSLLTYRAATGRGRKADGGLLPPLAMKGLFLLFGIIAIAIVAMGIWQRELAPVIGGIAYVAVALSAWRHGDKDA